MLNDENLRQDFEIAMLFNSNGRRGFFRRDPDGDYMEREAEHMFQGYAMARRGDHAQLARFAPTRPLVPGMLRQLNETLESAKLPPVTEGQVRVILRVVAGLPAKQTT